MINYQMHASCSTAQLLLVLSLFVSHSLSKRICDATLYGQPSRDDCEATLDLIPEAEHRGSPAARERHLFVEPQYLRPPFSTVQTPYENKIIQVPKIWRTGSSIAPQNGVLQPESSSSGADTWHSLGTCRIAIMSIADKYGAVRHGSNIAAWNLILNAGLALRAICLNDRSSAGGMQIVEGLTP